MFTAKLTKIVVVACASLLVAGTASSAFAESEWDANHPRRDQVNDRLQNQDHRINQESREGEIGRGEARQLHREDHQIRNEERRMAARDGGHISHGDQARLNRQENHVSRQIARR
jgi:hypothetical protein